MRDQHYDLVVVGSGAAGISAALEASALGISVALVSKTRLDAGATALAQGGLAAALAAPDSVEDHVEDTLLAGAGLCHPAAVRMLATHVADEVRHLEQLGARFDRDRHGALDLAQEGGHRSRRIAHAGGDATGVEVQRVLLAALRASAVDVLDMTAALDLLLDVTGRVCGVFVGETDALGTIHRSYTLGAGAALLATGGLGHAYALTTNPSIATGDGLAIGLRAGAVVRDLEFIQFHPTALWMADPSDAQHPLVTEALRGEGARLLDATGALVMSGVHPLEDLAPRDIVATAIARRMAEAPGGVDDHVFLDATGLTEPQLRRRFPQFLAACAATGYDPVHVPVPVAPAAHYSVGGLATDLSGRTSVRGLLAAGEVASSGVHGANRLASNGVTEAMVTGRRAARTARADLHGRRPRRMAETAPRQVCAPQRSLIQMAMSRFAGPLRTGDGLARLGDLLEAATSAAQPAQPTVRAAEDANLALVASAVAAAARFRTESRGCHRRDDAPGPSAEWLGHIEVRLADGRPTAALSTLLVPA